MSHNFEFSAFEEILRRNFGIEFGKESVSNEFDPSARKFPNGTLIRKMDISVTIRSGEVTKRYVRKVNQYAVL